MSFIVHNECLRIECYPESYTANHLACAVDNCIKQWLSRELLDSAAIYVVTDNAANVKAELAQLPKYDHLSCFAHAL